ncbi:MAG TPA: ATPase [Cyanobacteria bacterium UBA8156]|jgi:energy-coupling factor transporter ATP-binding protein EcfA2|nr:ATPase [Cyanobacteria bacterium UBA8156]
MRVTELQLQNLKCFADTTFSFSHKKSETYPWVTLLGENGVGKSTVLQALALLLAGPEAAKELMPRPTGWVRDESQPGRLTVKLRQDAADSGTFGDKVQRKAFTVSYQITGSQPLTIAIGEKSQTYTEPVLLEKPDRPLSWLRTQAFASGSQGWFAAGYGAFRRLTRVSQVIVPSLDAPKRSSNFFTQFQEDTALSAFERWMVYLDYRLAKDENDAEAQRMKTVGERAIVKLLPGDVQIAGVTRTGQIEFALGGQRVSTIGLSDGFRSIIALAGDLIWRLLQAFPDLDDPTQAPGVVLIDELDIHLHPTWQREIAGWLRQGFPNLQFLVATHSPLIAAGAGADALTLHLAQTDGQVDIVEIPYIHLAGTVERTLTSPAFGLESTYTPATARKIQRYHELRRGRPLQGDDKKEYQHLEVFMREIQPYGDLSSPDSLENRIDAFLTAHLP